ncbi:hypothetical protein [Lentzea sp. NEAU-D7]|uniref:hypothetical protein n=1 Tax=Lentzea sp. NEAU-D7 TaxID=2994667 RepID=UPI00224A8F94|nr:hypothetical protein [Lentzea sp. NEAU-D7]MCX2950924.1 hypothetical protein [Lentzea sp. NEAU-D7]
MRKAATTAVDLVRRLELRQLHRPDEVHRAQALQTLFERYDLADLDPQALISEVTRLLEDDRAFRRSVTAQLPAVQGNTISAGGSITATGGVIAGGDVSGSNNTDNSKKKTSFGGILVTVVAVAGLLLAGRAVINNLTTGDPGDPAGGSIPALTGSHTCRDFLAADQPTQLATLKRVYLEAGDAERAGDPFILQNGQYTCGQAPNMKLEKLARR